MIVPPITLTSTKRNARGSSRTGSSRKRRVAHPGRRCSKAGTCTRSARCTFAFGYGLYFYFTWLPTYLIRELGFSLLAGGLFSALPFVLAGLANLTGGWFTDYLAQTKGLRQARVTLGFVSFLTCAALMLGSTMVTPPVGKALLLAFALASADFALGACWAVCLDVGAVHAGVVTGFMNTFGNLGGLVGPIVVGLMVERLQSWTLPFYATAAVYVAGAVAWLFIDPHKRIA